MSHDILLEFRLFVHSHTLKQPPIERFWLAKLSETIFRRNQTLQSKLFGRETVNSLSTAQGYPICIATRDEVLLKEKTS